ncbi:Uncharacterised protein [Mycobacteroides abscessus subsp. abscessus]|nr:Uncharacterised protein [Mycobacteroides abscessus subsp. abscessus]
MRDHSETLCLGKRFADDARGESTYPMRMSPGE